MNESASSSESPLRLDVGPGLYTTSGGLRAMIPRFRKALDSRLLCFVNPREYRNLDWGVDRAEVIKGIDLPITRRLCIPAPWERKRADRFLARTTLISAHSFYRYHTYWTYRAYKKFGIPYWAVPHGVLDPYAMQKGPLLKKLFLKMGGLRYLKDAACMVFATRQEYEMAETSFGPLRGEIVHWPVEPADLSHREGRREAVRQGLGIAPEDRVLLYFGRVCGLKRPLKTIEAVASVKYDNLHLIVVGSCEEITEADCRSRADELGFKNLHFVGPVYGEAKFDYILASDAYISLSHRESFNLTAAECSSAGVPVILSAGNNLGPVVVDAGAGWHLHENNDRAFVDAIEQFLATDSETLLAMGQAGRSMVEEKFSWDVFQRNIQALAEKYGRSI
jgi:glycosyltransferase involved in cell wall biosynthesis